MRLSAALFVTFILLASSASAIQSATVEVKTTKTDVHVPATTALDGAIGGATWTSLRHNYMTARGSSRTVTLIDGKGDQMSTLVYNGAGDMTMTCSPENRFYVGLTPGTWSTIEDRMDYIEADTFRLQRQPNFYKPLSDTNTVKLSIEYDNIDLTAAKTFRSGEYNFYIRNAGYDSSSGKVQISINDR